jgi:lipoprotein-releasing system permease protein
MFKLEKRVYFIVLLLIIMMASISIVTTLVMVVLEKRRDIAVLRTMGAKGRVISTIFVIQGATIGLVGTVLGLLLGYIAAIALAKWGFPIDERVFGTSTVPVRIEGVNFLIVACVSFLITCLATIYPAKRASALPPTDALRYE